MKRDAFALLGLSVVVFCYRSRKPLHSFNFAKAMLHQPKPIVWGKSNEVKARLEYLRYMEENGHHDIKCDLAGFVVHPYKCWLGASPDAWVTDLSVPDEQGIAEFKCPYSKAFVHPYKACEDADFYCSIIDGNICLKNTFILLPSTITVICFMQLFKMV